MGSFTFLLKLACYHRFERKRRAERHSSMTDLHVCKCYIACINRAPLHGSIFSLSHLPSLHTLPIFLIQGSLHFIHLSYHISMETFLSFKIFLTSTIYVPVLTSFSEKSN